MRILLIAPPVEDFFFTPQRAYPLGLLSLATVLDQAAFKVKILNCPQDYTKKTIKPPREFSYLRRYYQPNKSAFCLFSHYYRFGKDDTVITDTVKQFSPQIVGISSNFTAYLGSGFTVAKLVKNIDKRITVVLGGRAATALPELVLKNPDVDFVLRGEAEFSLLKLCRLIQTGKRGQIAGLGFKSGGKFKISRKPALIKNLNILPGIDRRFIDYQKYIFQGMISTSIITSRGCNQGCIFCAISEPFRYRKAESVLAEMEKCFSLGIRHFNFEDDAINFNPQFEKILDLIIVKFSGEIKISFMNGILSSGINSAMVRKLVKAGLTHLDLSIASSSRNLRDGLRRKENTAGVFKLAGSMVKQNIKSTVHFIVGFPQQTFREAVKDLRVLSAKRVMLGPSIFYPVAESKMFKELSADYPVEKLRSFFRSSTACYDKDINRDRIFSIFYFSRVINFIKEIVDEFKIETGLNVFLKKKSKGFKVKRSLLFCPASKKTDRFTLSLILLGKLINEYRIYRIEPDRTGARYMLKQENFISENDAKNILAGLRIKSIGGRMVRI